jgi:hypothetical protein
MTKAVGDDESMLKSLQEVVQLFEMAQTSVFKLMSSVSVGETIKPRLSMLMCTRIRSPSSCVIQNILPFLQNTMWMIWLVVEDPTRLPLRLFRNDRWAVQRVNDKENWRTVVAKLFFFDWRNLTSGYVPPRPPLTPSALISIRPSHLIQHADSPAAFSQAITRYEDIMIHGSCDRDSCSLTFC